VTEITEELKKKLLDYSFVTAVGHARAGEIEGNPPENDEHVVAAFVREKKPESELDDEQVLPSEVNGVQTEVIEVGKLEMEPAEAQPIRDTGRTDTGATHRPAPHGVSIGHPDITAGTAGFTAWTQEEQHGVTYPVPVTVTNNHVGANENKAQIGDPILQPGPADGGRNVDEDIVGFLDGYIEIKDQNNKVDVAWFRHTGRTMSSYIPGIGVPTETVDVDKGDKVRKFGRTTGHKSAKVVSDDARVRVRFGDGVKEFTDQVIAKSFSSGGDSGSAVVNQGGELAGLLFAGSDQVTVFNKASNVLEQTGLKLNPGDVK
jgi:Trypsin.